MKTTNKLEAAAMLREMAKQIESGKVGLKQLEMSGYGEQLRLIVDAKTPYVELASVVTT